MFVTVVLERESGESMASIRWKLGRKDDELTSRDRMMTRPGQLRRRPL